MDLAGIKRRLPAYNERHGTNIIGRAVLQQHVKPCTDCGHEFDPSVAEMYYTLQADVYYTDCPKRCQRCMARELGGVYKPSAARDSVVLAERLPFVARTPLASPASPHNSSSSSSSSTQKRLREEAPTGVFRDRLQDLLLLHYGGPPSMGGARALLQANSSAPAAMSPWSGADDQVLWAEVGHLPRTAGGYLSTARGVGATVACLAARFGRTRGAITSRIKYLDEHPVKRWCVATAVDPPQRWSPERSAGASRASLRAVVATTTPLDTSVGFLREITADDRQRAAAARGDVIEVL
jgi:hypothetical protein